MRYNNNLSMQQLFKNHNLKMVLPQFPNAIPLQNVYSFAETNRRVKIWLASVLNGRISDEGELKLKGKQQEVLSRVRQISPLIESFFNSVPSVVKNIRSNTKVYTTFVTTGQIEDIKDKGKFDSKVMLMQDILDNIQYNPNFNSLNYVLKLSNTDFIRRQQDWQKKVNFK